MNKLSFAVGAKAKDRNGYVIYDGKTDAPYHDADGSGKGGSIKFATLTTKPLITAADFLVT